MTDKSAKAYTHQSNHEHPRKAAEKKVVFKSVLENPFRIRWSNHPFTSPRARSSSLSQAFGPHKPTEYCLLSLDASPRRCRCLPRNPIEGEPETKTRVAERGQQEKIEEQRDR